MIKKLAGIVGLAFMVVIMLASNVFSIVHLCDIQFNFDFTYILYLNTQNFEHPHADVTKNGSGLIVRTSGEHALQVATAAQVFSGEAMEFDAIWLDEALNTLNNRLNMSPVNSYTVGDIQIFNYFSSKLSTFVTVDGQRSNIQVAIREDRVVIGIPMILHSF